MLQDLFGQIACTQHAYCNAEQPGWRPVVKLGEGALVAVSRAHQQCQ